MASGEHQPQEVVADVVVEGRVEGFNLKLATALEVAGTDLSGHDSLGTDLVPNALTAELFVLALEPLVSAEMIDRAMLGRGHEPSARIVGDTRLRPLLERGYQSVLCQILGQADSADDPRQPGNKPRRLNPPDRVNRAMCIGGDHCYRSQHV